MNNPSSMGWAPDDLPEAVQGDRLRLTDSFR
jgi:hypothetical protein